LKGVRGQAGHFADGIFEPQHFQLADVTAQHAGVVAVAARVRNVLAELPQGAVRRRSSCWGGA
jgi:hypothetical protein